MKRAWIQAEDGTYYRNCPLIMIERKRAVATFRFRLAARLADEWHECWRKGLIRKDTLGRGDYEW